LRQLLPNWFSPFYLTPHSEIDSTTVVGRSAGRPASSVALVACHASLVTSQFFRWHRFFSSNPWFDVFGLPACRTGRGPSVVACQRKRCRSILPARFNQLSCFEAKPAAFCSL